MGLRNVLGDVALTLSAQAAGTVVSGPIANSGAAADVLVMAHVTAVSGSPTLNYSLEESADGVSSWTAVTGSAGAQLTAAGNSMANARASKAFVRVTATVAGTTPTVTGRIAVAIFTE
jgi:hypothetical protein